MLDYAQMLTVRREQMVVFEEQSWLRLAVQAREHLRKFFPDECAAMPERELAAGIRSGIRHGRRHGFELTSDYLCYLNLCMVFGWDFESRLPWAAEILARTEFGPHMRMDLLSRRALDELNWTEEEAGEVAETADVEEPEEAPEPDGLEDEEPVQSVDADEPEPIEWEPEQEPVMDLDPDIDYTSHEADFHG